MTTRVGPATDPRSRVDGLGWVSRAVFPDDRVGLTVAGAPPAGHQAVARYAVVPSVARARFLVPLGAPRAGAASLLAYNALRPPKVRALRAVLGGLARFGRVGLAPFPTLTVSVPAGVPAAELLLSERLSADLGDTPLLAAFGVRPPDPNGKPTLQLFSADGRPRGYAKIGWNDATRALVSAEAAALRALRAVVGVADHPTPPRLLTETSWAGQVVAVIEPLPPAVRGVPVDDPPRIAALLAVARRGRPGGHTSTAGRLDLPAPAGRSGRPGRRDRAGRCAGGRRGLARWPAGMATPASSSVTGMVTGCRGTWAGTPAGWSPGTGSTAGRTCRSASTWRTTRSSGRSCCGGSRPTVAASAVDGYLSRHGERLGLDAAQRRLVADAYLVEMWLRTWRLADAGAGWNAALHPALLDVIEKRHSG